MDYEKYFDNTAKDIKELKDWWKTSLLKIVGKDKINKSRYN